MDIKALKKLIDTCRKAGVTSFKNSEVEFTLSEHPIYEKQSKKLNKKQTNQNSSFQFPESSELSDEELLMWSSGLATDKSEDLPV